MIRDAPWMDRQSSPATAHHPTEKGFAEPQSIDRNRAQWAGTSNGSTMCRS
jgi:hypothetical protein